LLFGIVDALLCLRKVQSQSVGPTRDKILRRSILDVVARLDPCVDQRLLETVHPESRRVLGADDELVVAGFRREHRTGPANGELPRLVDLRHGRVDAEIKINLRVNAPGSALVAARRSAALEVSAAQAALVAPGRVAGKTADDVGDGSPILPYRKSSEIDARGLVSRLGNTRVKRVVDVRGHGLRLGGGQSARVILRHRFGDDSGQLRDRELAHEPRRVVFGSLAAGAVTANAALVKKLLAAQLLAFRAQRSLDAEPCGNERRNCQEAE
jgi:hypothetical protein